MWRERTRWLLLSFGGIALLLAGCAGPALTDRECMTRAMYFESNRSSPEGMLAVGTTVMNRLEAPGYPKTVCGVVGQPRQYAPGVLTQPMVPRLEKRVETVADAVLAGQRHPQVGSAKFFHTANVAVPYRNMHYVLIAGGNAFYEKLSGPDSDPSRGMAALMPEVVRQASQPREIVASNQYRASVTVAEPAPAPSSIDDLLTIPDAAGGSAALSYDQAPEATE